VLKKAQGVGGKMFRTGDVERKRRRNSDIEAFRWAGIHVG
jgi:hypothetical protein